jgi:hypothetical protein
VSEETYSCPRREGPRASMNAKREAAFGGACGAQPDVRAPHGTVDETARVSARVRRLTPELSKGLEFDLVVLIDPDAFGTGIEGALDRYVSMTRATRRSSSSRRTLVNVL